MPLTTSGVYLPKKIKDATAFPEDVTKDKVFYNNNGRQVGSSIKGIEEFYLEWANQSSYVVNETLKKITYFNINDYVSSDFGEKIFETYYFGTIASVPVPQGSEIIYIRAGNYATTQYAYRYEKDGYTPLFDTNVTLNLGSYRPRVMLYISNGVLKLGLGCNKKFSYNESYGFSNVYRVGVAIP